MRSSLLFLILPIVLISCRSDIILPTSSHIEKVESHGIRRYAFIKYSKGKFICNNKEITDFKSFRLNWYEYIIPNDGSNIVAIALQCPKNTDYNTIDSILNALRKQKLLRIAFMTNAIEDSVGIIHTIPPLETPSFMWTVDTLNPNIQDFSIRDNHIYLDDSFYNSSDLKNQLAAIIGSDSIYLRINLSSNNKYQDLITLLDSYYTAYDKYLNDLSFIHFQEKYDSLKWQEKHYLEEYASRKKIGIRLKHINEDTRETIYW